MSAASALPTTVAAPPPRLLEQLCLNRDLIDAARLTAQNQVVCPIDRSESVLRLHGHVAGQKLDFALATDAGAAVVVDAHTQVLGGFEHRLAEGHGQGLAG